MTSREENSTAHKILTGEGSWPGNCALPSDPITWIKTRAEPLRAEGQELIEKLRAHEAATAKIRQRLAEIRGIIENYERDIEDILIGHESQKGITP